MKCLYHMKNKVVLLFILLMCLFQTITAQNEVSRALNFWLGSSITGGSTHVIKDVADAPTGNVGKGENYTMNYKPNYHFSLCMESIREHFGTLSGVSYSESGFSSDIVPDYMSTDLAALSSDKFTSFSAFIYNGAVINSHGRFQIPIYAGPGVDCSKGDSFKCTSVFLGAKAAVKFYITSHIALYSGANYMYGVYNDYKYVYQGNNQKFGTKFNKWYVEAGLAFSFGLTHYNSRYE